MPQFEKESLWGATKAVFFIPSFFLLKMSSALTPAAYIQVHFRLGFFHGSKQYVVNVIFHTIWNWF